MTLSLESKIVVRWAVLDRISPQNEYGERSRPEAFKRGLEAMIKVIEDQAVATCKDRDGETCYIVAIGAGLYLDDREWLDVTYIKPSHGFTPHDFYSGYWLPAGITLRAEQ